MNFINLTPHAIALNNGVSFESSGIARVSSSFQDLGNGMFRQTFGEIQGLPEPQAGTMYIVSAMVFSATNRTDVVAPATGHPEVRRNERGHILSVPGFIQK